MADEEGSPEKASQAPTATGQGGGAPPGQQGNPSVYGGMSRAPMNPSMAPTSAPPRRGGMINKPKFSGVGKEEIVGNSQILKMIIGEFLGTALLVFFGIGSVLTANLGGIGTCYWYKGLSSLQGSGRLHPDDPTLDKDGFTYYFGFGGGCSGPSSAGKGGLGVVLNLHVSFGFGMAVACIAQAIGHISGAHLNPAVSFGLVAAGQCGIIKACVYSVIQIIGAVFGAGLLKLCTWNIIAATITPDKGKDFDPGEHTLGWPLGVSTLAAATIPTGIAIECWLTFILVLVVCGVCDGGRNDIKGSAPLAIGFAVFLCHVVGISLTGSSVNPARSIGPVLFVSDKVVPYKFRDLVVYIVGPMLGGILAGLMYNIFFRAPEEEAPPQQMSPSRPPSHSPSKMV